MAQALEVLAGGMIPSMMLNLGASLYKGPGSANVQKRVIVGVALCRLVIIPLFGELFMSYIMKQQLSSRCGLKMELLTSRSL